MAEPREGVAKALVTVVGDAVMVASRVEVARVVATRELETRVVVAAATVVWLATRRPIGMEAHRKPHAPMVHHTR